MFNLEIYDATGRLIQKETKISLFGGFQLDLTNQSAAMYILKLKNETGEEMTRRVVVN